MNEVLYPFKQLNSEDRLFILSFLIGICDSELIKGVSINIDTVKYDMFAQCVVCEDDNNGVSIEIENQVIAYKSIIAAALQQKYSFSDYVEGGISLMKKDTFLAKLVDCNDVQTICDELQKEYLAEYKRKHKYLVLVERKKYVRMRFFSVSGMITTLVTVVALIFLLYTETKYNTAYINAYNWYMQKGYVNVINSLSDVSIDKMDSGVKNILAISYVRTDNLTDEQISNIIDDINTAQMDILYDYWINIGRLDCEQAEENAKKLSDDELLLYAYMKDLDHVKSNTSLDGDEKESRIDFLTNEIEELKEKYAE